MTKLSVEQVHLRHRNRVFHFVSYEGQPDQPEALRDALFAAWLEQHVFASTA